MAHGTETLSGYLSVPMSRRFVLKRAAVLGVSMPMIGSLIAACAEDDDEPEPAVDPDPDDDEVEPEPDDDEEEPITDEDDEPDTEPVAEDERYGGRLDVGLPAEPPTLDIHQTTSTQVAFFNWHMHEPLYTWDEELQIMHELAESTDFSEDGLTVSVKLLEGVNFHNGEEMASEDVIASIERWARLSGIGAGLMDFVNEIVEVDDYNIEFHFNEPYGPFTSMLARQSQGCAIYPKSVIDESDDTRLAEIVGTGPYKFVEHQSDRHILLERFDDYTDRPQETSGYGGKKARFLDEIRINIVPDEASRISGLQAGEFHYLYLISADQFQTLDNDPNVEAEILPPIFWGITVFNMAEGPMTNQALRKAVQATLDLQPVNEAGYGEFYRLDPSLMFQETAWYTTAGEEFYNMADPERGAELLEDAGYEGEVLRFLTTQEIGYMYNHAAVQAQQLGDIGMEVDLEVVDWATLVDLRSDPGAWDFVNTGIGFRPEPLMTPMIPSTTWPGWWGTDEKVELVRQLETVVDFDERFAIWEDLQRLFYEVDVPFIKIGDELAVNGRSPMMQGFDGLIQLEPAFYNVWLAES